MRDIPGNLTSPPLKIKNLFFSDVESDFNVASLGSESNLPIVATADVQLTMDSVLPWLQSDHRQPFLLVGPEGSGKTMLLRHCFAKLRATNVATVHCSANITPQHVIQKLSQVCLTVSSSNGRIFAPKECDRLILYFKDLNLAKPDMYGTSMIIAFLQQVLTYQGFYDQQNEWVGLRDIQIVGSMTAGTGLGRHALSTRFTSIIRVFSVTEPDKESMETIYSSYLYSVLKETVPGHPVWANPGKVAALASSMVGLYNQVKAAFSVDDYSHYLFTPRDLTRWCRGLMRYRLEDVGSSSHPGTLLQVWAYEAARLFRDKLVGDRDQARFDNALSTVLRNDWGGAELGRNGAFWVTAGVAGSSTGGAMPSFGRSLGKLDKDNWATVVQKGRSVFERESWELAPYCTQEALDMAARYDRVLSQPGGSLLLAGRAGVGRRAAVCLVSALHSARLVTLKMGKNFGLKQFRNELKSVMQASGVEGEQIFLMIEDHNIISDEMLDLLNSLLSSGEIPGLYSPEELEPLITPLKQAASNAGYSGDLFSFFAKSVQTNLHIVLVMDCSSPEFVANCESNPAFYKECSVQWTDNWSPETFAQLPQMILQQEEGEDAKEDKGKKLARQTTIDESLAVSFYEIHKSLNTKTTTPAKFLTFVRTYQSLYGKEKEKILNRKEKLSNGVSKLNEAREVVAKLKSEAGVQEKRLAEKQGEANNALQMITDTMKNANTQKSEMQDLKTNTLKEEALIQERKKHIDEELREVEPLIAEAKKSVGNIKNTTLTEVRSLRAPPTVIRDILEATLILMGIQDTTWNSMKNFLAKRGIKEEIRSFDARRINPKSRQAVEEILQTRGDSFTPANAQRASAAAVPLASWVIANVKYSYVLEKIKPLEQEQNQLQANLRSAEDQLEGLTHGLDEVDAKVAVLKQRLNQFTKEAAEVEISLAKTTETISSADKLVAGLEGEYQRWKKEVSSMSDEVEKLPVSSLMAAACLTYLADMPEEQRRLASDRWSSKLGLKRFDLKRFLSSEQEMLQWRADGLPSDDLSLENAITMLKTIPRPFIVDPSSQATEWLKTHLGKEENLEVTNVNDERFFLNLELAVRFGKTLIIQDVNQIEPILYPLLREEVVGQGPYKVSTIKRFIIVIWLSPPQKAKLE